MSNLYADVEYLKAAIDDLLAQCPELIDDEALRADMLEGSTEIGRVFSAILKNLREDKITVAGIDAVMLDLNARRVRAALRQEAKRDLLRKLMERADLTKLILPEATLSLSWHKPAPFVTDETALPDDCVKLVRTASLTAIREHIESAGEIPPGVAMSNGAHILTIREK